MMRRTAALTFDIHQDDRPEDIVACAEWLRKHAVPATFFVPTMMLDEARFSSALRELDNGLHDIGTHTHMHDSVEIAALEAADPRPSELDFLDLSTERFHGFFGRSPRVFRSPFWCYVNDAAADRLTRLGYTVDSSSTPQRPGVFSSNPSASPWLFSPRSPHLRTETLLEVPTSCLLFPLNRTALSLFRMTGSLAFLSLFMLESALAPQRPVVMQFHVDDLVPTGLSEPRKFRWSELLPARGVGINARYWLIDMDRGRSVARTIGVCDALTLAGFEFATLSTIHRRATARRGARP